MISIAALLHTAARQWRNGNTAEDLKADPVTDDSVDLPIDQSQCPSAGGCYVTADVIMYVGNC